MPDTYVKLPNGKYVQIPADATPEQLQQMKTKLVQMQATSQGTLIQNQGTIGPPAKTPINSPENLGARGADAIRNYIQQAQNLTPQGAAAHPVQNVIGKAAGFAFGGTQGIGTEHEGILTNLITSSLIPGAQGEPALAGAIRGAAKATSFGRWLTSSKSAGAQALEAASAKVGGAPVELSAKTNELVDELVKQGASGGTTPKVVTDLLKRLGPAPGQVAEAVPGPLTYNEARLFQGNMSSLSAAEQSTLKGAQKGLVKQLAKSFAGDVQKAADAAGAGPEHAIGMQEYAAASSRNRVLAKAGKAAGGAAGLASVEELLRFLYQRPR